MDSLDFNSSLYRILGERIKSRRVEMRISQEELARSVGLGRTSITNIELGKHNVPLPILYKLSEVLELDLHYILPTSQEVETNRTMQEKKSGASQSLETILNSKQIDEKSLNILKDILGKL